MKWEKMGLIFKPDKEINCFLDIFNISAGFIKSISKYPTDDWFMSFLPAK